MTDNQARRIVTEAMQTTGRARPKSTESGEVRP